MAFARRFGKLETHPFLPSNTGEPELVRFEKTAEVSGYENSWHHDVTWRESPSMGAILHAVSVPDLGGDTLFSDMYAAYDALDDETKAAVDSLQAVHDFTQTFGHSMTPEERRESQAKYPPVRHPVVCTHPATGKLHLYVNRPFVSHIEGSDPDASHELLDRLCRQADSPEHQCRFRWTKDAVAIWDNRAPQHYASSDYWPPSPDDGACVNRRDPAHPRALREPDHEPREFRNRTDLPNRPSGHCHSERGSRTDGRA